MGESVSVTYTYTNSGGNGAPSLPMVGGFKPPDGNPNIFSVGFRGKPDDLNPLRNWFGSGLGSGGKPSPLCNYPTNPTGNIPNNQNTQKAFLAGVIAGLLQAISMLVNRNGSGSGSGGSLFDGINNWLRQFSGRSGDSSFSNPTPENVL